MNKEKNMENKIILEDGREIEVDDTPYLIKDGILYVFVTTFSGANYKPMGKVKEE